MAIRFRMSVVIRLSAVNKAVYPVFVRVLFSHPCEREHLAVVLAHAVLDSAPQPPCILWQLRLLIQEVSKHLLQGECPVDVVDAEAALSLPLVGRLGPVVVSELHA